jgi:alkaline phosphatase D
MKRDLRVLLLAAIFTASCAAAQEITPVIRVDNPPNTAEQQAKHYVILVSLDGFRYDYPAKYGAPHLQSMAVDGASAPQGMLPSYPSLTFPNHLTLVTGLYPEHHGIVANSFYDPARTPEQGQTYVYKSKTNTDGSWYSGTPLWSLAEQQGMRAACLFWPGSEAEIAGKRPSFYEKFDDKLNDAKRVDQVIAWLGLPPEQRPHFITMYFSNVDHAGHTYGPDSEEVRAAVHHVDDVIGALQAKLATLKLPVDLIVVADHGMVAVQGEPIDLSSFADLSDAHTEGSLIYAKDEAAAEKIYEQFKAHPDPRFSVYRRAELPKDLNYDSNARTGDPVVVPNGPYELRTKPPAPNWVSNKGEHGYDPLKMPEMKAIFFAEGPDIKAGVKLKTFQNADVYPAIARLLQLRVPVSDATGHPVLPVLRDSGPVVVKAVQISGSHSHLAPKLEEMSDDVPTKIGLGVTPPVSLQFVSAEYTDEARGAKISGTVKLMLRIEKDGRPSKIVVVKGLGHGLDQKAVEAASQSTFKPALKDGRPVVVEVMYETAFNIY